MYDYFGTLMARHYHHPHLNEIKLTDLLFALSDPIRLEIIKKLHLQGEMNSLALVPDMPKSTLTHHTKILREAGVTQTIPDGRSCIIRLRAELFEKHPALLSMILED